MRGFFLLTILCIVLSSSSIAQKIPVTTNFPQALVEYQKGFLSEDQGKRSEAAIHYANAVKIDSTFALGYLALAMVQNNSSERRNHLDKAVRYMGNSSEGEQLWIKGRNAFYGNGKDDEELSFFESLAAKYPKDEIAQYLVGYMYHHHGRKNFIDAIKHMEAALKINPDYITPYNDLGYAYLEIRDFKNAERTFKKYIELLPGIAAPLDSYADMLMRSGQFQKSMQQYDRVIALDPDYPWAYFGKAGNLNFLNRHNEAREVVKPLLAADLGERDKYHVWIAMECSYLDEGKPGAAIDFLIDEYVKGESTITFVQKYVLLTHIIRLCYEFGKQEQGWAYYQKLSSFILSESQNEETRSNTGDLSFIYQATGLIEDSKFSEAMDQIKIYENRKGEKNDNSKLLRAKLSMKKKQWEEALNEIDESDLDNPYHQFVKAQCLKSLERKSESKSLLKSIAIRNETQSVDYHLVRRRAMQLLSNQ